MSVGCAVKDHSRLDDLRCEESVSVGLGYVNAGPRSLNTHVADLPEQSDRNT